MDLEVHELGLGARVRHPDLGVGVVFDMDDHSTKVFFQEHGEQHIGKSYEKLHVIASGPALNAPNNSGAGIDGQELKDALREVLAEQAEVRSEVELAGKWEGGTLILEPASEGLQPKEVPLDTFFHKIVMMRDRLRVLEQKINAHKVLSDADKVELQQYITRIYGSMTTFNVLFANKDDSFSGEGGKV